MLHVIKKTWVSPKSGGPPHPLAAGGEWSGGGQECGDSWWEILPGTGGKGWLCSRERERDMAS